MLILDIILALSGAIVAIALLVASTMLYGLRRQFLRDARWRRQVETLAFLTTDLGLLNLHEIEKVIVDAHKLRGAKLDVNQSRIIEFLHRFEAIALGVNQQVYDEELVYRVMGRVLLRSFPLLRETLYNLRSEFGSFGFIEYESLVRRWQATRGEDAQRWSSSREEAVL